MKIEKINRLKIAYNLDPFPLNVDLFFPESRSHPKIWRLSINWLGFFPTNWCDIFKCVPSTATLWITTSPNHDPCLTQTTNLKSGGLCSLFFPSCCRPRHIYILEKSSINTPSSAIYFLHSNASTSSWSHLHMHHHTPTQFRRDPHYKKKAQ